MLIGQFVITYIHAGFFGAFDRNSEIHVPIL